MLNMTPIQIIFYIFAGIAIGSAIAVITVRNPVRSVLSLVVTFFAMAGIWMILRAEFLSLILLLVYVGAVMTLFLFVVMMLSIEKETKRSGFVNYFHFGIVVVLLILGFIISGIGPRYFGIIPMPVPLAQSVSYSNLTQLGRVLYTEYVYPFEIAGVLLLVAMIAAITLAHRKPLKRKVQHISDQISRKPEDSVRIIKMAPEPKEGT